MKGIKAEDVAKRLGNMKSEELAKILKVCKDELTTREIEKKFKELERGYQKKLLEHLKLFEEGTGPIEIDDNGNLLGRTCFTYGQKFEHGEDDKW